MAEPTSPHVEIDRMIVVDVSARDYVCPECGGAVALTESQRRDTSIATARPCGHAISLGRLGSSIPVDQSDTQMVEQANADEDQKLIRLIERLRAHWGPISEGRGKHADMAFGYVQALDDIASAVESDFNLPAGRFGDTDG